MTDAPIHIGEVLARNARMYPDDAALIERIPAEKRRRQVTWKEFDDKANAFSNALRVRNIGKGDKVVHFMNNSIDWLIAYFGIVRTGAWVAPLNFRFTADDLKYCCEVTEPQAIVFDQEFAPRVDAVKDAISTQTYVCLGADIPRYSENFTDLVGSAPLHPIETPIALNDPCGLYFTSGTTGQPKPILLTHANMMSACITENAHHRQTRKDTFILIPPLYHTGAKMHWFGSFVVGGPAVILKGVSPEWILETVSDEQGTIVFMLVPWAQDLLLKLDSGELKLDNYKVDQWRLMHIGAQPVPPSLIMHWRHYFPAMQYDTNFGLSESTGPGCVHLGIENTHKIGAIGLPGFNWEARIVDDNGNDMPQGEAGELIVRGDGVMREYYKNPEATSKTLRNGWLYTGDITRRDEDGFIWIVDRKKDVIITGGENVFPVEIEEYLHANPKVKDVAVIGLPDDRLGEIVVAIVEVVPGNVLNEEDLFKSCEGLPRYKRPRKIIFGEVPRNPTGKIEKPKLRKKYTGKEEAFKI